MRNPEEAFELGDKGEAVVRYGLRRVYRRVWGTPKTLELQMKWNDIVVSGNENFGIPMVSFEVKTEYEHTGNLFFETVSNVAINRPGWAHTSTADELFYLFWDEAKAYRIPRFQDCKFLFNNNKAKFREVPQHCYKQNNRTLGRLVPLTWLKKNHHGLVEFDFVLEKELVENGVVT